MEQIPCVNQDVCPLNDTQRGCFEDVHHLFYPRTEYTTPTEKEFRQLDENKVRMCRQSHNDEHALNLAPDKPDLEIMRMAIDEQKNRRMVEKAERLARKKQ